MSLEIDLGISLGLAFAEHHSERKEEEDQAASDLKGWERDTHGLQHELTDNDKEE